MRLKILIVDDAGFIRHLLEKMVTDLGHTVIGEARNGNEAIRMAKKLKPDGIFMDLVLPEKNGVEASVEILKLSPKMPIVAMSTLSDEWIRTRAITSGCIYFLAKPFSPSSVELAIEQIHGIGSQIQYG